MPDLPISTVTPTKTPLPASLPKFPLNGYVMLFTKNGDLYFQDGENTPAKLTHLGEKAPSLPHYISLLSDDNQKVVFIRRDDSNIYSINTDGTQEHIIISSDKMNSFGSEMKIGALRFVPNSHQLFFVAIQCKAQDNSPCPTSAFLTNTDTGGIKKLADLGSLFANPNFGEFGNIKISPDGKMLAVGTPDGMDIFTLDCSPIRGKVLPYKPSTSSIIYPSLFWLPDSSGLIMALPDTIYNTQGHGDLTAHTIWRYTIANDSVTKIPLDPPPWMYTFDVSPDGNWIAYGGYSDPTLYLGNLANGHTQSFGEDGSHPFFVWSPNSKHLMIGRWTVVTSFDKPPVVIAGEGARWIDPNHFISNQERFLIAEIRGDEISYYDSGFTLPSLVAAIKPKR
jgi:WD40 repeat protein